MSNQAAQESSEVMQQEATTATATAAAETVADQAPSAAKPSEHAEKDAGKKKRSPKKKAATTPAKKPSQAKKAAASGGDEDGDEEGSKKKKKHKHGSKMTRAAGLILSYGRVRSALKRRRVRVGAAAPIAVAAMAQRALRIVLDRCAQIAGETGVKRITPSILQHAVESNARLTWLMSGAIIFGGASQVRTRRVLDGEGGNADADPADNAQKSPKKSASAPPKKKSKKDATATAAATEVIEVNDA
jgi:hypothetical protein